MRELPHGPISIDVSEVLGEVLGDVRKSVTSLYSSLVTRPTGRAVRAAIEMQLIGAGSVSLSLIDFSEVAIIDFSCADEVVAKLVQQYLDEEEPVDFLCRVAHLRAHALEIPLPPHGNCEYCEGGSRYQEIIRKVEKLIKD